MNKMINKICLICGKHFEIFPYRKDTAKYCSMDCKNLSQKKKLGSRKGQKKGIYKKCEVCEKLFYCYPSEIDHRRFCSRACSCEIGRIHRRRNKPRKITNQYGYIMILVGEDYPNANCYGRTLEHRYVMEQHLGRYLTSNEEVHHRNGIKNDNRLENLELVIKKLHYGKLCCPYCGKEFKIK